MSLQIGKSDIPPATAASEDSANSAQTNTVPAANGAAVTDPASAPKPKDAWDKADVIAKILIPVALGILGLYGNYALQSRASKDNDIARESAAKLKKQELAMNVLLSNANAPDLRQWAASVLAEGAGLPLRAKQELEQNPLSTTVPKQTTQFVAKSEGCSLRPYPDNAGVWTIGCGHTIGVTANTPPITEEQAEQILATDLKPVSDQILPLIKVPLTENQRTALIDFAFQVGVHAFATSKLLIKLNEHDYAGAGEQFKHWVHQYGIINPGLAARRDREVALWDQPNSPPTTGEQSNR